MLGGMAWWGNPARYDRFLARCSKLIALEPDHAKLYISRGFLYYCKGDYDSAWADVKRCRELGGTPDTWLVRKLEEASGRSE